MTNLNFKSRELPSKPVFNTSFLLGLFIFSLIFSTTASAQGNLLIFPKRVVFDASKRSEELSLANIGKDTATYVLSFVQIRMKDDGTFDKITQPDSAQLFADKNLRFFPRSVTLAPNESQTVKVQVTKTNELLPGEYRSHLYFRAIPNASPLTAKEPSGDSGISIKLIPIFGISIPMIIRVGENTSKVSLSNIAFQTEKDTVPTVKITLNRTGNMSVYGDITVDHISNLGIKTRVGMIKGLAVYTPNILRRSHLMLNKVPGVNYHSGKLHITYADQSAKALMLAEEDVNLNDTAVIKK